MKKVKRFIKNVYDFNGHLYYELPNGELMKEYSYPISEEEENQN